MFFLVVIIQFMLVGVLCDCSLIFQFELSSCCLMWLVVSFGDLFSVVFVWLGNVLRFCFWMFFLKVLKLMKILGVLCMMYRLVLVIRNVRISRNYQVLYIENRLVLVNILVQNGLNWLMQLFSGLCCLIRVLIIDVMQIIVSNEMVKCMEDSNFINLLVMWELVWICRFWVEMVMKGLKGMV